MQVQFFCCFAYRLTVASIFIVLQLIVKRDSGKTSVYDVRLPFSGCNIFTKAFTQWLHYD